MYISRNCYVPDVAFGDPLEIDAVVEAVCPGLREGLETLDTAFLVLHIWKMENYITKEKAGTLFWILIH